MDNFKQRGRPFESPEVYRDMMTRRERMEEEREVDESGVRKFGAPPQRVTGQQSSFGAQPPVADYMDASSFPARFPKR